MELKAFLALGVKWWWLLLMSAALAAGAGYFASRAQPPTYRATATIFVAQYQYDQGVLYDDPQASERLNRTYAELIRRRPVLSATVEKLGLSYSPAQLGMLISVRIVPNTQLLEITVSNDNPGRARDIANTLAAVFIAQQLEEERTQTSSSQQTLGGQIAALENKINASSLSLEDAKRASPPQPGEVARLEAELAQAQGTYSQLIRAQQEMQLAQATPSRSIKLAEAAETPGAPESRVPLYTFASALAGLLFASGLVLLLERLDDTVKTTADVQRLVDLAALGVVGRIPADLGSPTQPRLLDHNGAHSPLGEAYRMLRFNLDFSWAGLPGKIVALTSAERGEGKTTTLANLAIALAKDNRAVIAVDADLRRPSLHRVFCYSETADGLSNLLAKPEARLSDYLLPTKLPNLSVLPAGSIPPNPAELLGSGRFVDVVHELKQASDIVLIDTPPLLAVSDPALVATKADGVIVVLSAGGTRMPSLVRAVEILRRSSTRILGVVLNKVSERSSDYYYRYYRAGEKPAGPRARLANVRDAGLLVFERLLRMIDKAEADRAKRQKPVVRP